MLGFGGWAEFRVLVCWGVAIFKGVEGVVKVLIYLRSLLKWGVLCGISRLLSEVVLCCVCVGGGDVGGWGLEHCVVFPIGLLVLSNRVYSAGNWWGVVLILADGPWKRALGLAGSGSGSDITVMVFSPVLGPEPPPQVQKRHSPTLHWAFPLISYHTNHQSHCTHTVLTILVINGCMVKYKHKLTSFLLFLHVCF